MEKFEIAQSSNVENIYSSLCKIQANLRCMKSNCENLQKSRSTVCKNAFDLRDRIKYESSKLPRKVDKRDRLTKTLSYMQACHSVTLFQKSKEQEYVHFADEILGYELNQVGEWYEHFNHPEFHLNVNPESTEHRRNSHKDIIHALGHNKKTAEFLLQQYLRMLHHICCLYSSLLHKNSYYSDIR